MPENKVCDICGTEIREWEGSYTAHKECSEGSVRVHSDCMIRESEFAGDHQEAEEIQMMDDYYAQQLQKKKGL